MSTEDKKTCCGGNCQNCDLILWKNPTETGKIFFGSIISLLILKKVNLLTFFTKLIYTILLTTGSIEFVSKIFLGQGLVTKYGIKECPNTVAIVKPIFDAFLKQLPVKQAKFRMLVFAQVPKNTFKAAFVFYLLNKLFSWFSVWTIIFGIDIAIFTLPIFYKTYQKEIDAYVVKTYNCVKSKSEEQCKVVFKKLEPTLKKCKPLEKYLNKFTATQANVTPESTTANLAGDVGISTGSELPNVPKTEPVANESNETTEFESNPVEN